MNALTNIKQTFAGIKIRQTEKKLPPAHKKQPVNTKSIGIIFDADNVEDFIEVRELGKKFIKKGKQVTGIGFLEKKESYNEYLGIINHTVFNLTQLNWCGIPVATEVDNFIATPFDLLIDLNYNSKFPLYYIARLSRAKFKLGPVNSFENFYDLSIEMKDIKNNRELIQNSLHYLGLIYNL